MVIGLMTFFLGFPSGIVLASMNWIRMDLRGKAVVHIIGGIVGILAIGLFYEGNGQLLGLVINLGYMTYLHQQMKNDIDRVSNTDIQYAHWFSGLLISIATIGMIVIVALVVTIAEFIMRG
jgi:hypothetical protein